ncbi:hypothetical protein GPECTOR_64g96 [Gonium pectorale]|uniref:Kinesin-like protein n=1 Tax=Gonium pectorale TaxID=33097 RepID=A0A150G468_GONPE|nr:hypothetical protein GPECTOR_64g96 [Gonium pectorale]|eukprot:KXZ44676.1 hypothetical protein GPECTOR_64g96 [Gonium pectorale]
MDTVFARIRPLESSGYGHGATGAAGDSGPLLCATDTEIILSGRGGRDKCMAYSFDHVFQGSDQREFYEIAIEPLVEELVSLRAARGVFMAYGASGTGKSYTMQGTSADKGVIPRAIDRIYQVLAERKLGHQVQLSYYEVYENKVYDLLQSARQGKRQEKPLTIQQNAGACCIPGLLKVNSESSRSHAIFTVQLLEVQEGALMNRSATLSLVDLAGAERAGRTKLEGSKLRESAAINNSLSVLSRCLEALRYNQSLGQRAAGAGAGPSAASGAASKPPGAATAGAVARLGAARPAGAAPRIIPYRDSSLTSLFKGVLSGQGNLVLSVHLSQDPEEHDTNRHTLRFGANASRLQLTVAPPTVEQPQQRQAAALLGPKPGRGDRQPVAPLPEPIPEEEEEGEEEEEATGDAQQRRGGRAGRCGG